ncbi:hypothetical protein RGCCGE502_32262 (plasmid) [Rhizobium grahamii CCGE 502]|uniref:Uncharacterized protein n=1 Tax=Rhizobium grahamii CCGE 502 TaxID=990285 RepID=S3H5R7_9HYPH|nr:hypothetical protein RGCCGE502_32262 [Rhizobium grahamii CCGE 502]
MPTHLLALAEEINIDELLKPPVVAIRLVGPEKLHRRRARGKTVFPWRGVIEGPLALSLRFDKRQ